MSDRTTKQRDEMGNPRKTLQGRENGKPSITIKYFKGIAKILNTTKNWLSHHPLV